MSPIGATCLYMSLIQQLNSQIINLVGHDCYKVKNYSLLSINYGYKTNLILFIY